MPATTKHKARKLEQAAHARQMKRRRIEGDNRAGIESVRAEATREAETSLVNCTPPCTLIPPLPKFNASPGLTSCVVLDELRDGKGIIWPKPVQIVYAPQSTSFLPPPASFAPTHTYQTRTNTSIAAGTPAEVRESPSPKSDNAMLGLEVNNDIKAEPLEVIYPDAKQTKKSPPQRTNAVEALQKINKLLRPPRKTGPGYKKCKLDYVTHSQYQAMASCLRFFLRSDKKTFTNASYDAAAGAALGNPPGITSTTNLVSARFDRLTITRSHEHGACWLVIATRSKRALTISVVLVSAQERSGAQADLPVWSWALVLTSDSCMGQLPVSRYLKSRYSLLKDEDIEGEIKLLLQRKGKYAVANNIVQFLDDPETRQRLTLTKGITVKTAQHWLRVMQYRWKTEKSGQYVDGHEREDVIQYRKHVYAPKIKSFDGLITSWDDDGLEKPLNLQPGQRQTIIWWHDASTFYAHDRRHLRWVHQKEHAFLAKKGLGASVMVADFVSAEYGFMTSHDGKSNARKTLFAGKNRDGYMTNYDICEQFQRAVDLVKREYPNQNHVFVYDNARIHTKRDAATPSALGMTKGESDFGVLVAGPDGKEVKCRMNNPKLPNGLEQVLYLPNGKFKGMATLLQERGYDTAKLKAQCRNGFKCDNPMAECCCRRILYNLIDVNGNHKAILQSMAERLGTEVIFLPKFHCELNPIEQCWGYAKGIYRMAQPSSLTADVQKNMLKALDRVPISSIRKFVARSRRFLDAYAEGLDGPNAAACEWARRKFKGHRNTPEHIHV